MPPSSLISFWWPSKDAAVAALACDRSARTEAYRQMVASRNDEDEDDDEDEDENVDDAGG